MAGFFHCLVLENRRPDSGVFLMGSGCDFFLIDVNVVVPSEFVSDGFQSADSMKSKLSRQFQTGEIVFTYFRENISESIFARDSQAVIQQGFSDSLALKFRVDVVRNFGGDAISLFFAKRVQSDPARSRLLEIGY